MSARLHACPLGAPPCPICRARAVEQHLEHGRSEMALRLIRGLADEIGQPITGGCGASCGGGAELGREKGRQEGYEAGLRAGVEAERERRGSGSGSGRRCRSH